MSMRAVVKRCCSWDGYIHVANSFAAWPPVTDRLDEISVPTLTFNVKPVQKSINFLII